MGNIVLNKTADASNYVNPFTPAKGINGSSSPISRWIGSSPISAAGTFSPIWFRVDLGTTYWVNRWVISQMGNIGWSQNYNLSDYKLQGSVDNANWFDMDSVVNNSSNVTDRTMVASKVRWLRVYITKGLRNNNNFASFADLEVYEAPPTDSTLSALTLNNGTTSLPTNPAFVKTINSYTTSVNYDTASISVTVATTDPNATITVNGIAVPAGQASQQISLTAGAVTPINVVVTPVIGDPQTYTINVTRASSPYLSNLAVKAGLISIPLTPSFAQGTLLYNATAPSGAMSVNVFATTEVSNATIKINGNPATSGQAYAVTLGTGTTTVNIEVTAGIGTDVKSYAINITK